MVHTPESFEPCESCGVPLYRGEDIESIAEHMHGHIFHQVDPPAHLAGMQSGHATAWAEHLPFRCQAIREKQRESDEPDPPELL
jgi:hypothetical protein